MFIEPAGAEIFQTQWKIPQQAYLNSRPLSSDSGPHFTYVSGGLLTREKLTRETRLLISKGGLNSREFAGHSFRIGAATTAASANLPPWLIKVLGR